MQPGVAEVAAELVVVAVVPQLAREALAAEALSVVHGLGAGGARVALVGVRREVAAAHRLEVGRAALTGAAHAGKFAPVVVEPAGEQDDSRRDAG